MEFTEPHVIITLKEYNNLKWKCSNWEAENITLKTKLRQARTQANAYRRTIEGMTLKTCPMLKGENND